MIFGSAGVGKTTLLSLAGNVVVIDLEDGTRELDVPRISGIENFKQLRSALGSPALDPFDVIGLDSASKAQDLSRIEVFDTIPGDRGKATRMEDYGYGRGYQHLYDMFSLLIQDLDRLVRRGKHVVLIAHDTTARVPNPTGEDFIRFEPRLQSLRSGKADIRDLVVEWCDNILFLGYDVITEDGKGRGGGTRTIFTAERPSHIAKTRRKVLPSYQCSPGESTIWKLLLGDQTP